MTANNNKCIWINKIKIIIILEFLKFTEKLKKNIHTFYILVRTMQAVEHLKFSLNTIIPFNYILMLMDNGILLIAVFPGFHMTRRRDRDSGKWKIDNVAAPPLCVNCESKCIIIIIRHQ